MRFRQSNGWETVGVVLTAMTVVAGIMLAVRMVAGTPAPSYLDAEHPTVSSLAGTASSEPELLQRLMRHYGSHETAGRALWQTQSAYRRSERQDAWVRSRSISLVNHPAWPVPVDPEWSEDPFGDLSWQSQYHSLGWLQAPAQIYADTGQRRYAREVARLIVDWIQDNPGADPPSVRSWYDHSVAWRTDVIVSMVAPILSRTLSEEHFDLVMHSLHTHGELLRSYLDEDRFIGHNHNLFHALSLYNLAVTFPELRDAGAWRIAARSRVSSLLAEMVHIEEGVTTEQASAYHYLALRLFRNARDYLEAHGDGFGGEELSTLRGMVRFGALVATPAGSLPAIGDTPFASTAPIPELQDLVQVFADPYAEYVLSHGQKGSRPPDAVFYVKSGYVIMRPSYGQDGGWEDDLHLVVDMGPQASIHGHHDAMNVLLAAYGEDLLVDSGGPYAYGIPERDYFVSAQAHNGVVVDQRQSYDDDVRITRMDDRPRYSMVEGVLSPAPGVEHRRTVALLKPGLLMVLDRLSSASHHSYESLYHLPPGASVSLTPAGGALVSSQTAGLAFGAWGSESPGVRVSEGFVTSGHRRRVDAPVLAMTQESGNAWFVVVAAPTDGEPQTVPELVVEERADSIDITISWQGNTYRIEAGDNGADFSGLR